MTLDILHVVTPQRISCLAGMLLPYAGIRMPLYMQVLNKRMRIRELSLVPPAARH